MVMISKKEKPFNLIIFFEYRKMPSATDSKSVVIGLRIGQSYSSIAIVNKVHDNLFEII